MALVIAHLDGPRFAPHQMESNSGALFGHKLFTLPKSSDIH